MGREVRMVPANWEHPKRGNSVDAIHVPLHDGACYQSAHDSFIKTLNRDGLQAALDDYGSAPDMNDYMPQWTPEERTHYMMYEDTSEGTPISPAFSTPEALARWLADNGASSFGSSTANYDAWLRVAKGGWAPSMIITNCKIMSGVEAGL